MIRVAIVDDQALVRGGLRAIIESSPNLEVIGEAANGAEAIELVRDAAPDVVLMDIRMPVLDGLAATEAISRLGVETRILVLTTFDVDEYVYRALRAGASGFLLKDTRPSNLIRAIEIIAAGEALLAPSAMRHLIEAFACRPDDETPPPVELNALTGRELDVLRAVAKGWSNPEIAESLYVSPATIKTHISRLLMKLAAHDRAQLIVIAYETGLVEAQPKPPAPPNTT